MSVVEQRALAPPTFRAMRRVALVAALALAASVPLLLRRVAPEAPAVVAIGVAGVSGLAAAVLAFMLDEASLWRATLARISQTG
ncbi:MAG TPA: hypothetical protein VKT73_03945 [Xanthobacteraceae bacterium]|nr:hypothetical protein [Xanthobacteraceae bacterium]